MSRYFYRPRHKFGHRMMRARGWIARPWYALEDALYDFPEDLPIPLVLTGRVA